MCNIHCCITRYNQGKTQQQYATQSTQTNTKNLPVMNLLEISVSNENQPWIGGEILETLIQQNRTPQYIVSW